MAKQVADPNDCAKMTRAVPDGTSFEGRTFCTAIKPCCRPNPTPKPSKTWNPIHCDCRIQGERHPTTNAQALPKNAAEVLLALIIEDQPEREYGSSRYEVDLGLDFPRDGYPTAFWKSPFFSFLRVAPDAALNALIALVNFCTERWIAEIMQSREGMPPGVILLLGDGCEKTFLGWRQVFGWPQSNSMHNGNLFSALDALERWLTLKLDAGDDISAVAEQMLREGNSAALVSVLLNVAKYRPSLLSGVLAPLLTFPERVLLGQRPC